MRARAARRWVRARRDAAPTARAGTARTAAAWRSVNCPRRARRRHRRRAGRRRPPRVPASRSGRRPRPRSSRTARPSRAAAAASPRAPRRASDSARAPRARNAVPRCAHTPSRRSRRRRSRWRSCVRAPDPAAAPSARRPSSCRDRRSGTRRSRIRHPSQRPTAASSVSTSDPARESVALVHALGECLEPIALHRGSPARAHPQEMRARQFRDAAVDAQRARNVMKVHVRVERGRVDVRPARGDRKRVGGTTRDPQQGPVARPVERVHAHAVDRSENLPAAEIDYHAGGCDSVEIGPRARRALPGFEPAVRDARGGGVAGDSWCGGVAWCRARRPGRRRSTQGRGQWRRPPRGAPRRGARRGRCTTAPVALLGFRDLDPGLDEFVAQSPEAGIRRRTPSPRRSRPGRDCHAETRAVRGCSRAPDVSRPSSSARVYIARAWSYLLARCKYVPIEHVETRILWTERERTLEVTVDGEVAVRLARASAAGSAPWTRARRSDSGYGAACNLCRPAARRSSPGSAPRLPGVKWCLTTRLTLPLSAGSLKSIGRRKLFASSGPPQSACTGPDAPTRDRSRIQAAPRRTWCAGGAACRVDWNGLLMICSLDQYWRRRVPRPGHSRLGSPARS